MLFQKQKKSPDQLSQGEREAIVDLLHLCLYADAHISLREGDFISDVVEVIGWDQNLSFASYEQRSVAGARAARATQKSKTEFFEYAASRLQSPLSRRIALELCRDLCAVDGMHSREETLLGEIRASLQA